MYCFFFFFFSSRRRHTISQGDWSSDVCSSRVVREDPNHKGRLAAGTETGMFISFNGGADWQAFQLNLPVVPITDLAFHKREQELVVATQGRSFWILDDVPLL